MSKYITYMRVLENGTMKNYSYKKSSIYLLFFLAITLPIALGFTLWGGFNLFQENYVLKSKLTEAEKNIEKLTAEKNRFVSYFSFLEETNQVTLSEIFTEADIHILKKETLPKKEAPTKAIEEIIPQAPLVKENENTIAENTAVEAQKEVTEEQVQAPVAEGINLDEFNAAEEAFPLDEEYKAIDDGIIFDTATVRIEAVKLQFIPQNVRLALNFDLYNINNSSPITGNCEFSLLKDGDPNQLVKLIKLKSTSFRISNMKAMSTMLGPENGTIKVGDKLKMNILVDKKIIFTQILPIQ